MSQLSALQKRWLHPKGKAEKQIPTDQGRHRGCQWIGDGQLGDCENPATDRSYCATHYPRVYQVGSARRDGIKRHMSGHIGWGK